jgi:hypothetical protein
VSDVGATVSDHQGHLIPEGRGSVPAADARSGGRRSSAGPSRRYSGPIPGPLTGSEIDALLGPVCPHCGWRRGNHRPASVLLAPCPTRELVGPWRPERGGVMPAA